MRAWIKRRWLDRALLATLVFSHDPAVRNRVAVSAVRVRANSQTRSKSKRNATLAIDDDRGRLDTEVSGPTQNNARVASVSRAQSPTAPSGKNTVGT